MKTVLFMIALWMSCLPLAAWAIEGYSGSMWGTVIYDATDTNPKTLGSIRQGIDWVKLYDLKLSTYAQFRYRFEQEEAEFFNAYGPSLGAAISRGSLRVGWEHQWERFSGLNKLENSSLFYVEWWFGWDLKNLRR
jgi:hypothetical protein